MSTHINAPQGAIADTVLLPGESKNVTITIQLIRSPLDHTSGTFTIKFTADAVETD